MDFDWEVEEKAGERNERAYQQAMLAATLDPAFADLEHDNMRSYGEMLARMYYPHLFTK